MRGVRTYEFIEGLRGISDPSVIAARVSQEASSLGFSGTAMAWLPSPVSEKLASFEVVSLPAEYFERYSRLRYDRHSAVVKHMSETALPFRWDRVPVTEHEDPVAKRILAEAWDFGIRSGWSVPMYRRQVLVGFVTVASARNVDECRDLCEFHLMAMFAHAHTLTLKGGEPEPDIRLSSRERDVLSWLAAGRQLGEIAAVVGISERSAHGHVVTAGMKLGAAHEAQTIIEALRLELIEV